MEIVNWQTAISGGIATGFLAICGIIYVLIKNKFFPDVVKKDLSNLAIAFRDIAQHIHEQYKNKEDYKNKVRSSIKRSATIVISEIKQYVRPKLIELTKEYNPPESKELCLILDMMHHVIVESIMKCIDQNGITSLSDPQWEAKKLTVYKALYADISNYIITNYDSVRAPIQLLDIPKNDTLIAKNLKEFDKLMNECKDLATELYENEEKVNKKIDDIVESFS